MRATFLIIALGLAATSCSRSHRDRGAAHVLAANDAQSVLVNRNWIDRWPTTKTDKLHVYRFVPDMGGGVFQDRTIYKGTFELFRFYIDGDHIEFDLPETHEHMRSQFQIEAIDGPHPFDLRLTIWADPRGPQVYYGIRDEAADKDGHVLEQQLASAAALLKD